MVGVTAAPFEAACRVCAPDQLTVMLGALRVRVRVAGPLLAERLFDPLLHLIADEAGAIDLSVDAWSRDEVGLPISPDEPALTVDPASGRAVCRFESADALPRADLARPFQNILLELLHRRGLPAVHAALVAPETEAAGLLLVGPNGSGKSTSTLSAVMDGFGMVGDDCFGIERRGDRFLGHSLYRTCCLTHEARSRFKDLPGPMRFPPGADAFAKGVLTLPMGRMRRSLPVSALVFPDIGPRGGTTRAVGIGAGEGLRRFMPALRFARIFVGEQRQSHYAALTAMVGMLPCFRLDLGGDFTAVPAVLRELAGSLR